MAVDDEGHVLAVTDYFTTDPQVMVACVPMQGVRTIYMAYLLKSIEYTGLFGWECICD